MKMHDRSSAPGYFLHFLCRSLFQTLTDKSVLLKVFSAISNFPLVIFILGFQGARGWGLSCVSEWGMNVITGGCSEVTA